MSKVVSLAEAAGLVRPGHVIAFGGFNLQNKPMAAVRQLVREDIGDLTLVCPAPSSLDVDMLVGAGQLTEVLAQSVSAEDFAAIAPCFRRACERGAVRVVDVDQGVVNAGLRAGKMGLDSIAALGANGTSAVEYGGQWLRQGIEPFSGRAITYIRQLRPDVAFVHALVADTQGRALQSGTVYNDGLLCAAARTVVVTAERIVESGELAGLPGTIVSWRDNVAAVVHAPLGGHPTAIGGSYGYDGAAIEEYRDTVVRGDFAEYRKLVIGASEEEYLARLGVHRVIALTHGTAGPEQNGGPVHA